MRGRLAAALVVVFFICMWRGGFITVYAAEEDPGADLWQEDGYTFDELDRLLSSKTTVTFSDIYSAMRNGQIDEAMENGYSIADIQLPVVKAVAASGILGVGAYYQLFPDELTDEQKADIEYEKN